MALPKQSQVNIAIAVISGVSAFLSIVMYFERKKDRQLQSEIMQLDKTIKQEQLNKLN
jgi:cell division protein FtsL